MASEISRSPDLAELLRAAIDYKLVDVHTSLPGRIEKFDKATQTADVQPLIKRRFANPDGTEVLETLPVIPRVPVAFPRAGKFFITWPLKAGDLVELVFSEASRDNFKGGDGSEADPDDFRRFDLSDAVAHPCGYPESKPINDFDAENIAIGFDGGKIVLHMRETEAEITTDGKASKSVAVADFLQILYTSVKAAFDGHTHATGVGPSGPPLPISTFPAWDAKINSDKLKIPEN